MVDLRPRITLCCNQGSKTGAFGTKSGCGPAIIVLGRILLLLRETEPEAGCWGLPDRKVDLYEVAVDAAQREVAEDLGIEVTASDRCCLVDQIDKAKSWHWFAPVYLVTSFTGEPRLIEPEKHADLRWFPVDQVPTELTVPTIAASQT